MKRILTLVLAAAMLASCANFNPAYLLQGGAKLAQAASLSDAEIREIFASLY